METKQTAPEVRRILIVRLSALGDIVMASGLIPALRARYPGAKISWVCQAEGAPLLIHNEHLEQVIIWPRKDWVALAKSRQYRALWRAVAAFRARLRQEQFDLVLDAQGLLKSGVIAWLTAAPRRIGIASREGSRFLQHEVFTPPLNSQPPVIGSEYRALAQHLGAPEQGFKLDVAIGSEARATALSAMQNSKGGLGCPRPWVILAPFTTRPQKHWVESHWAELAARLLAQGLQPVMLGGPSDHEAAQRIAQQQPLILNLVGRLKLDESAALIGEAQLLIGVDTGLTHMGSALQTPTLALFGSTAPYLHGQTPSTQVVYSALPCSPCHRNPTCHGTFVCMSQLSVGHVFNSSMALLGPAPWKRPKA